MRSSGQARSLSFGNRAPLTLADALSRTRPVRYQVNRANKNDPAPSPGSTRPEELEPETAFAAPTKPNTSSSNDLPNKPDKAASLVNNGEARQTDRVEDTNIGSFDPVKTGFNERPKGTVPTNTDSQASDKRLSQIKDEILPGVLDQIDGKAMVGLSREELLEAMEPVVLATTAERKINLNNKELAYLRRAMLDEIVGFGPLEPLLADSSVNDILVNAPDQVYAERYGKLELTEITFRDNEHIHQVANKICNWVGRRVDMSTPMADARLPDGSRVNVIVPPLALRGPSISIRKFAKHRMELPDLVERDSLSQSMARFMQIATHARLNIVISGGTGSGKTTMLNALSQYIDPGERIVTIEDAAELQLRQPHVVPLETRPSNLEGTGLVTISDLLINALRMRPDRIILGEVRGKECFDMLQAFNTGHDGGMCTLHANRPREALSRMENLVAMANPYFPTNAVRQQISETIDIVIQVKRMRDGKRRVTDIVEVIGMEGEIITTQSLFSFEHQEDEATNEVHGTYEYSGLPFRCAKKVREAGLGRNLEELLNAAR